MKQAKVPRSDDDYTSAMAAIRQEFIDEQTGVSVTHIAKYTLSPEQTRGNIENFTGAAQVPLGLAGPLLVNGEHAQGTFYVPMATTEGTLVGSYSRGMKLTSEVGGIHTKVLQDGMQRSPVFGFSSASEAALFGEWVNENFGSIRKIAEDTTQVGKLNRIEQHAASRFRFLRFHFHTGDAAGQNMVSRATAAACNWIIAQYPSIDYFALSGNFCTDKKHSHLNSLSSRGKRVVAEITIPEEALGKTMGITAEELFKHRQISNLGGFMAGINNNGLHSANALAAIFIATGQDVANIAESSAGIVYSEITPKNEYYFSITIPSLIIATHGGGTGLPTQHECLQIMDCVGERKAIKLAEIIAATVLCGELSLGSAILSGAYIEGHEKLGRNRT